MVDPAGELSRGAERRVLAAVLLLALLAGLAFLNPYLDSDGDNAGFLVLAKSIASGRGFTSINFPEYIPHTLYYPLYPLILSPIVAAWPGNYLLPKLPSLVFAVVFVWAVWNAFRRRVGAGLCTLGLFAAAVALNRHVAEHAAATLTDVPYFAFSFLALAWAEARGEQARFQDGLALGALTAAAYMTRPVGITLVAAVLAAWLLRKRWAAVAAAAAILSIVMGVWSWRNATIVTSENRFENPVFGNGSYRAHILARDSYRPDRGQVTPVEFFMAWRARILANFNGVGKVAHPAYTLAEAALGRPNEMPVVLSGLVILVIFVGWARWVRAGPGALELYMFFYLAAATLYPAVRLRYVLPIMPLALFYLVRGTDAVVNWARRRTAPVSGPAGAAGIIVLATAVVLSVLLLVRQGRFTWVDNFGPRGASNLYDRVDMGADAYFRAVDWIAERSPKDAVIMGSKPWLAYLRSGHPTTVFAFSYDTKKTAEVLRRHRVDFLIDDSGWHWQCLDFLLPALEAYPDAFELVHTEPDPETRVYRVNRAALPPPEVRPPSA